MPPLKLGRDIIAGIKAQVPEVPQDRRKRLKEEYQLEDQEIEMFVFYKELGEYFEKSVSELKGWLKAIGQKKKIEKDELSRLIKICANYLISDLQGLLKESSASVEDLQITPENFAEFVTLIYEGKISSKLAKQVLSEMFSSGADPSHIIKEKGLNQIVDESELEEIIKEVVSKNPKAVEDFQKGKGNSLQFLIGQVMAQTKGKASPELTAKILQKALTK